MDDQIIHRISKRNFTRIAFEKTIILIMTTSQCECHLIFVDRYINAFILTIWYNIS